MAEEAPSEPAQGASRLFQIYEDDLVELERILPELCSAGYERLTNRSRVQFRRLKEIVSNVRWDYGPPGEVKVLGVGPASPSGG